MKNTLKLTAIAALVTMAGLALQADQTNLVQNLNIKLVGLTQGGSSTNRNSISVSVNRVHIETPDVIAALGAATGTSFSSNARLVLITPLAGGSPSIAIRDGSTSLDVSGFFGLTPLSDPVSDYSANLKNGKYMGDSYNLEEFTLQDAIGYPASSLHFEVRGILISTFSNFPFAHPQNGFEAHVNGLGDNQGGPLLIHGTISASGQTLEVVPGGGVPPPV